MKIHELKSWPEFFEPVYSGVKAFELRKNDRGFALGDYILLKEWEPGPQGGIGKYTGREIMRRITFILDGIGVGPMQGVIMPYWGLDRGYCILSLAPVDHIA
jgi:hypothetical protein